MKIQPDHAAYITAAVQAHDTEAHRRVALLHQHSDRRYRWDCLWRAKVSQWLCDTIYPYANDDHIDTVLRQAIPPLD